jgi:hypothetical protein
MSLKIEISKMKDRPPINKKYAGYEDIWFKFFLGFILFCFVEKLLFIKSKNADWLIITRQVKSPGINRQIMAIRTLLVFIYLH